MSFSFVFLYIDIEQIKKGKRKIRMTTFHTIVLPKYFEDPHHQTLFKKMRVLLKKRKTVDVITLSTVRVLFEDNVQYEESLLVHYIFCFLQKGKTC